jgi:hypothetical protein
MPNSEVVNINPHPQILQVLGEIEFKPWQCLAELVDNSIDEFIRAHRSDNPIKDPTVMIAFGLETVVVKDNGPGMSIEALSRAVTAGWSSNERYGNLGLYGVGFNIATARLGSRTTIWTTKEDQTDWVGLELDLKKLASGGAYILQVLSRPKSEPKKSGTEIEVTQLREDWRGLFTKDQWIRPNITERLARIYGTMLRTINPAPIGFKLLINNRMVSAWEHCVWPEDLAVFKKGDGDVRPVVQIDQLFSTKYLCRSTNQLHDTKDSLDPDDVIEIPERVYGWIGVQRYADENDFGIDILRYGRKIETGNKDVFTWEDTSGKVRNEYPIDDPRNRGRIVGELHLDHGYVHYTKHRFEREHLSWRQLLSAVRNNEPLTKRKEDGFTDINNSPLGKLFRTFRRNSPGSGQTWRDILFIQDNDLAKKLAHQFRKGEESAREEKLWNDALVPPQSPIDELPSDSDEPNSNLFLLNPETTEERKRHTHKDEAGIDPKRTGSRMPELDCHISSIGPSQRSYDFETFVAASIGPSTLETPWLSRPTSRGVYEIDVVPDHPIFKSASFSVRDAVILEMAHTVTVEESRASSDGMVYFSAIFNNLRVRYSNSDSLDLNRLALDLDSIKQHLLSCLETNGPADISERLLSSLSEVDISHLKLLRARDQSNATEMLTFASLSNLYALYCRQPDLFFQANCFSLDWSPNGLDDEELAIHRQNMTSLIRNPLDEASRFSKNPTGLSSPEELMFIRSCINRLTSFLKA